MKTIFKCPYLFFGWERDHQLITYAAGWGMGRVIQNAYKYVQGGEECHVSCKHTHVHYLVLCFWQHFCHIVSCFICRNLTLPLLKKKVFVRNSQRRNNINFCRHKISYFYSKKYLRTRVSQKSNRILGRLYILV